MITDYHAKYFAYELTKRAAPDSVEKLAGAFAGAQVDLNPHQVDAALFAFSSPLSKGALLADEVGLGKTIEAGLVISQYWAEGKRSILVITPSNLRKQWHQELSEKFFLPCTILESRSYNEAVKSGRLRPFNIKSAVIICSYQFARSKATDIQAMPCDIVIIDEAHRLRNVYKPSNVIANTLKQALSQKQKLLLTATPLQNSLLELFGLVSFIDEHTFGDLRSFREQFTNLSQDRVFEVLRQRLRPICHRTLRRQVTAYVPYTRRLAIVEEFTPSDGEDQLYELVSDYLRRENLQALPASQRSLMTLVLRKLLASSTFAIAGALTSMSLRLQAKLAKSDGRGSMEDELSQDYEGLDATAEEWVEDDELESLSRADRDAIEAEIADLDKFAQLATSIEHNAKGKALLKGLDVAFAKAEQLGAASKAIIFTESRKTQAYLLRVLADSSYADGIVLFNGSNTDERSREIYTNWLDRHRGTDRVSGSKTADMRSALVDYFRDEGRIMIATEAGAEGINLQFCSLVVNYDLPWNPQRIEQRIGRSHRYGQKHDVVVVNFLNRKNEADQRVYELLSEKFKLFDGVFGAMTAQAGHATPAQFYEAVTPTGKRHSPPPGLCWIYTQQKYEDEIAKGNIYFPKAGDGVPRIKRFLSGRGDTGLVPFTIWKATEVGTNDTAKKSLLALLPDIPVFENPKPEQLLQRIVHIATNPGDLILDSFAGSGTAGAVAHKMGRRWIMVEIREHCDTHIIPRIRKVIDGTDSTGVSAEVGWLGGGGFRYFRLAPSLLETDRWGREVVSKAYNAEMLSEALCKIEGFTYAPSDTTYWQHGNSTERDFIYVTTQTLGVEQLQQLSEEVGLNRTLLVLCSAFRGNADRWPNLTLKKIPNHIRSRCEWGRDDYSLNVENLPKAQSKREGEITVASNGGTRQCDLFSIKDGSVR